MIIRVLLCAAQFPVNQGLAQGLARVVYDPEGLRKGISGFGFRISDLPINDKWYYGWKYSLLIEKVIRDCPLIHYPAENHSKQEKRIVYHSSQPAYCTRPGSHCR